MIPMICTKALPYAGRRLKPGDAFNARGESDARLLAAIGKAVRAPAPTPIPAAPPVVPRAFTPPAPVVAAPEPAGDPAPTPAAPAVDAPATGYASTAQERTKRAYRRRDLTAE